jgi:hypothetical protein
MFSSGTMANNNYVIFLCSQEKQRKKKKIKIIKNKNRLVTQEVEVAQVQQSWQKFVTKVYVVVHSV